MPRLAERTVPAAAYFPYNSRRAFDVARRLAGQAVKKAISARTLTRSSCERCGKKRGIEAHHDDYSNPLVVRWFCRVCHRRHHAELRRLGAQPPLVTPQFQDTRNWTKRAVLMGAEATEPLVVSVTQQLLVELDRSRLSQVALASRLNISRQRVNQYFHGGIRTLAALAAIAEAAGCEVTVSITPRSQELKSA